MFKYKEESLCLIAKYLPFKTKGKTMKIMWKTLIQSVVHCCNRKSVFQPQNSGNIMLITSNFKSNNKFNNTPRQKM